MSAVATDSGCHGGELIADAAKRIKGGGGKGADFAVAGGKDAAGIDAALAAARGAAGRGRSAEQPSWRARPLIRTAAGEVRTIGAWAPACARALRQTLEYACLLLCGDRARDSAGEVAA